MPRPSSATHSAGCSRSGTPPNDRGGSPSLVAIGDPGAALPGVQVKMPLSILTVRGLGRAVLASPMPRSTYRRILGQGTSSAAARSMPDELVDVLRHARRRKGNPQTVASLMHAIDGFRRPRPETVMSDSDLARIRVPTSVLLGPRRSVPLAAAGAPVRREDSRCGLARSSRRARSLVRGPCRLCHRARRSPEGNARVGGHRFEASAGVPPSVALTTSEHSSFGADPRDRTQQPRLRQFRRGANPTAMRLPTLSSCPVAVHPVVSSSRRQCTR